MPATLDKTASFHWPARSVAEEPTQRSLGVPTAAASAAAVRRMVRAAADSAGASLEWTEELVLAVDEAFSNAVNHGTGTPAEEMEVRVELIRQGMWIELGYRGEPFDTRLRELPDDILQNSGRGRYLMRELLDDEEYRFERGMTTLRIFKRF